MDQLLAGEAPPPKSKGISQLHFNAINNASSRNNKHSTNSGNGSTSGHPDEQKKLIPSQKKYIITPSSSSASSSATSPQPSTSNGVHKTSVNNNGTINNVISSEGSSATPSTKNSPMGSPTSTRPKHFNSLRSIRSGNFIYNLNIPNDSFSA